MCAGHALSFELKPWIKASATGIPREDSYRYVVSLTHQRAVPLDLQPTLIISCVIDSQRAHMK